MLNKIWSWIFTKERIITWISALIFAVGAIMLGMKTDEFKSAVCGATVIEQVKETKIEMKEAK